jgi:hypothetical protein
MIRDRTLRDEDYIKETIDYFKKNMGKGYDIESLKWSLINQGKSRVVVDKAVEMIKKEQAQQNEIRAMQSKPSQSQIIQTLDEGPEMPEQPKKKGFFSRIFG